MNVPLISICIPSYERVDLLQRLLESIRIQTFRDFEVIVSDDSKTEEVARLVQQYSNDFQIHYHRNEISLGTPRNWNHAISKANGTWVKLMHDDDWFSGPDSLEEFVKATKNGIDFIWSYHTAVYDSGRVVNPDYHSDFDLNKNPYQLFSANIIGPPSCVLVRRAGELDFDGNLKWLVDIDYYISQIRKSGAFAISKRLVNIGFNETQVTNSCFMNRQIEIPEALRLYQKFGSKLTSSLSLYNAWWRLVRNLEIRHFSEVEQFRGPYEIPDFLARIIKRQHRISLKHLQIGFVSRVLMILSFLTSPR